MATRAAVLILSLTALGCASRASAPDVQKTERRLLLLHASDSESEILGSHGDSAAEPGVAGLARFVGVMRALERRSEIPTLRLAAGDTFMPAPALDVIAEGRPLVADANGLVGWHASALGNHEFDRGEQFLASMVSEAPFAYLSATLRFEGGPLSERALRPRRTPWLHDHPGRILPRGKLCAGGSVRDDHCDGVVVGVIGATTETLRSISSTAVSVRTPESRAALLAMVQAEADALAAEGIDIVILLSHLQDVRQELALVEQGLRGVDVIVSGGGDDRLADPAHRLLPGDPPSPHCAGEASCYPLRRVAADGAPVLIVATDGQFRYVGELSLRFDERGHVASVGKDSRPWPVDERTLRELGASKDPAGLRIEAAVADALSPSDRVVAHARHRLEGDREALRSRQTNLGDLCADSLAFAARARGHEVAFALRNAGGIRAGMGPGPITRGQIEEALRFDNPLVIVRATREAIVEALEASLRGERGGNGHFPQVSSELFLAYDLDRQGQLQRVEGGEIEGVERHGDRLRALRVAGEIWVEEGRLLQPDREVTFVTLDYLARGGDGWFPGRAGELFVTMLDLKEQQALAEYLVEIERRGEWLDGERYPDPLPGVPESFTRVREEIVRSAR